MQIIEMFQCGICRVCYTLRADAERCEARGLPSPRVAVGDIVETHAGFGWLDGDPEWVSNAPNFSSLGIGIRARRKTPPEKRHDTNCFGPCCTMAFYYVVTAIDRDPSDGHRIRYHLETMAMSGNRGYRGGYTFDSGHYTPRRVLAPTAVVEAGKMLIGHTFTHLL